MDDHDNSTVSATHVESNNANASLGAKEATRCHTRYDVHVHSVRKRLTDSDGVSAKALIDGIVKAGLLKDDSPEYVRNVTYSQEKGGEEKTLVQLIPVT